MTDEDVKQLVTKHDLTLTQFATSIEHLVSTQVDINKRLEEISNFLTKQTIQWAKLDTMDRELAESFKRVHIRIDIIENIQKTDSGCNSVKLLHKDVESISKDVIRLTGAIEEQRIMYEHLKSNNDKAPSPALVKWVVGILIGYSVMFGTYVVQTFSAIDKTNARLVTKLDRDIEDTKAISSLLRELERTLRKGE